MNSIYPSLSSRTGSLPPVVFPLPLVPRPRRHFLLRFFFLRLFPSFLSLSRLSLLLTADWQFFAIESTRERDRRGANKKKENDKTCARTPRILPARCCWRPNMVGENRGKAIEFASASPLGKNDSLRADRMVNSFVIRYPNGTLVSLS